MKIVISPAKSLDFETELPTRRATQPPFLETTEKVNRKLARMSKKELSELMNISDKLAELNHTRYQEFTQEHDSTNARPAVYAFAGDVYVGLDAYTIETEKLDKLQDSLRILSGFYGVLRPLDLIQPYRLEMGTDLAVGRKKNLYELWQAELTKKLNEELEDQELFINLASKEYFKAIDTNSLNVPVITPVFKDLKNGKLKIVSFFAKKARGAMVRYIIDENITDLEGLKGFNIDGYQYSEAESGKKNELVFIR